jgi:hypothetical protein
MTATGDLVFSGNHLRATLFHGVSDRLAITFSFRETGRTDFADVTPARNMAARGLAQLAITAKVNDWFVNPDTAGIETMLRALTPHYKAVHMLGFSMGGYGAFRFAMAANATYVLAVSPQFSIHPDVVPFDKRFRSDAQGFDRSLGDLTRVPRPDLQGAILVDPFRPLDLINAQMLTTAFPRVRVARLAFGGHPATRLIARAGKSGVVQRAALDTPPHPAQIIAAHRAARASDAKYHAAVAARLLTR